MISQLATWWSTFLNISFQLCKGIIGILTPLIWAALVLLIGWFLALFFGRLIKKVLGQGNIPWDKIFSRIGLTAVLKDRLKISSDVGALLGWLVKWFLIAASFMTAMSILQLQGVNIFLGQVVLFLPLAIAAALIVFVAFFLGNLMSQTLKRLINSLNLGNGKIAGFSIHLIIILFGIFSALKLLLPGLETLAAKFADFLLFAAALAVGIGVSRQTGEWFEKIKSRYNNKE